MEFTNTFDYAENDPCWDRNDCQPEGEPTVDEAERQAAITAMVAAATLDESYAALWIAQGIPVTEARHRVAVLMRA